MSDSTSKTKGFRLNYRVESESGKRTQMNFTIEEAVLMGKILALTNSNVIRDSPLLVKRVCQYLLHLKKDTWFYSEGSPVPVKSRKLHFVTKFHSYTREEGVRGVIEKHNKELFGDL